MINDSQEFVIDLDHNKLHFIRTYSSKTSLHFIRTYSTDLPNVKGQWYWSSNDQDHWSLTG